MKNHIRIRSFNLVVFFSALATEGVFACPACYGNYQVGNRMSSAANWGIIAMCIIMFTMLGGVFAFIRYLTWRAKNPLPDYEALLREDGEPLPTPEPTS